MTTDQLTRVRRAARNIPVLVPHAGTRLLARYVEMLADERDRQAARIAFLESLVATLSERCARQSELLSRRAEG